MSDLLPARGGEMSTDEYGRRALEFVSKVSVLKDRREITTLVEQEFDWYGLSFVTSLSFPDYTKGGSDNVDMNTRPSSYAENYVRKNLLFKDPVIAAMRRSLTTLSWSDVRREFSISKSEQMIIDEGRDFGASDGLTIPVLSNSGCIGIFSPCGHNPDLSQRARAALELIGLYAHQALHQAKMRETRRAADHTPLTPREREVMRWIAVGKSNDEIGSILGIQGSTVKTLLGRAQLKLNAATRTYAVVQALRLGELDLNF